MSVKRPFAHWLGLVSATILALSSAGNLRALTITSGPTFSPASAAPLAGLLSITTDVPSRISILVSDGNDAWERDFYDYTNNHAIPLLGFKPDTTNEILVTVYDQQRNATNAPQLLTFITKPLPANFPTCTILKDEPDQMEPGYIFCMVRNNGAYLGYILIMDNTGTVVWYMLCPNLNDLDVRPLDNGDFFIPGRENRFTEYNMLGQAVATWNPIGGYPINPHEGFPTSHGTILYLSDVRKTVSNFPSSDTVSNPPLQTVNYDDEPVVEMSATNSTLLNTWSPLDVLEPTRVTYLTYGTGSGSSYGVDDEHANALIDDTNDNSIIVSLRNQDAVYKISRSTGQLKWILGSHANWGANWQPYLLTPLSTPMDWNYGQHAPELTSQGTLILYNDNNYAASPFDPPVLDQDNYSSCVEYSIDETNMAVTEVWNSAWQTNQDRLFTPYVGKVAWLEKTRNILVTYGAVSYINGVPPSPYAPGANMARLIEYTHDPVPQVVFDASFFDYDNVQTNYQGYFCYRAYPITDLYAHPPEPVSDLTVTSDYGVPRLEFSADPAHIYMVQASTDLNNWTSVGPALEEGSGDYYFVDLDASQFAGRFYRVVTQ